MFCGKLAMRRLVPLISFSVWVQRQQPFHAGLQILETRRRSVLVSPVALTNQIMVAPGKGFGDVT
jgi:hypothetical protein